jgi:stearoyl-CoA desaturase (delta-9 desaturase)
MAHRSPSNDPSPARPQESDPTAAAADGDRIRWLSTVPFWTVHALALAGIIAFGWSWTGLGLAVGMYYLRMFGITAGYHRYFAHRSFKAGRVVQFLFALLGSLSVQKGVLWWAAHHRDHHKYSDLPEDVHSPVQRGFWWSHVQWILVRKYEPVKWDKIRDMARFPELRFLQRFHLPLQVAFAVALFAIGGTWALLWGFFVSTTMLWHGTFAINSFAHIIGSRRYNTTDASRNNLVLALVTMGEGWHNNHHYYQRSASQGFYWWEIDISYYLLRVMSWFGLVWDLHTVPTELRDPEVANERLARKQALRDGVTDTAADDASAADELGDVVAAASRG